MKEFRTKIKQRIMLLTGVVIISVVLDIYNVFVVEKSQDGTFADGTIIGFQFGIAFGIGIVALIQIIKLRKAMKDDSGLKALYNYEHDERLKTIRSKAGMPMLLVTSILILIAAIIAGYFNFVIFNTLVITAMVQLSIGSIVKLYCMKTM